MRRISDYGPSLMVLATAVVVLFAGPFVVKQITYEVDKARVHRASSRLDQSTILEQLNQAYRDIAMFVEPSVVHISARQPVKDPRGVVRASLSSGSGWVYDEHGHIVTNHHVVENAQRIEVQLHDGDLREAELIGFDTSTDIAVIKVEPGRLHPAAIAESSELVEQGDLVFAFGSPFDFRFSMSSGVVSGKGRTASVIRDQLGQPGYENFIQVDAAINPGNSGGPLTDHRGQVIGMNTAIATGRGTSQEDGAFAGIGLAIPITMIQPVVEQLIENGFVAKGFLGINALNRNEPIYKDLVELGLQGDGVYVGSIDRGQSAHDAGLRRDDVIVAVEGRGVASIRQLLQATRGLSTDDTIRVRVWRYDEQDDRSSELIVMLPGSVVGDFRGVRLLEIEDEIANIIDLMGFAGRGVRIIKCQRDGPARAAGLRRHDIIVEVNGDEIGSMRQLQSVVSSIRPGDVARVTVWRFDPETDTGGLMTADVLLARLDSVAVAGTLAPDQNDDELAVLGIAQMETNTPAIATRYGMSFHEGVVIHEIVRGSPLDAYVDPGATITHVGDRPVTDTTSLLEELRRYDLRRGARVTIVHAATDESRVIPLRAWIR